jgi:hypothetical protein
VSRADHTRLRGAYDVVFASSAVAMGTAFETLQRLMNEHTAGTGDGVSRVTFG